MQLSPPPLPPGTPSDYGSPQTVTMYNNVTTYNMFLGPLRRKRLRQLAKTVRAILRFLSEPFKYILVKYRRHGRNAYYTRRRPGYLEKFPIFWERT